MLQSTVTNIYRDQPHIIEMLGNDLGNDFIGTDPHGHLSVLEKVVELLGENDRLFLCGDLVDRGSDSLELIRYIKQQYEKGKKIYAIRGNHEDIVLGAIDAAKYFSSIDNRFKELTDNLISRIKKYEYNKSTKEEAFGDLVATLKEEKTEKVDFDLNTFIQHCLTAMSATVNGAGWIFSLDPTEREEVKEFIQPLPYMIRVGEAKKDEINIPPFDIVHAAPLSEKRIHEIIASSEQKFHSDDDRSKDEIAYLTWTDPEPKENTGRLQMKKYGRSIKSILTYVGHNSLKGVHPIYQIMNVVNLDAGTFDTQSMLVAHHTQAMIKIVEIEDELGDLPDNKEVKKCRDSAQEIIKKDRDYKNVIAKTFTLRGLVAKSIVALSLNLQPKENLTKTKPLQDKIIIRGKAVRRERIKEEFGFVKALGLIAEGRWFLSDAKKLTELYNEGKNNNQETDQTVTEFIKTITDTYSQKKSTYMCFFNSTKQPEGIQAIVYLAKEITDPGLFFNAAEAIATSRLELTSLTRNTETRKIYEALRDSNNLSEAISQLKTPQATPIR